MGKENQLSDYRYIFKTVEFAEAVTAAFRQMVLIPKASTGYVMREEGQLSAGTVVHTTKTAEIWFQVRRQTREIHIIRNYYVMNQIANYAVA